MKIMKIIIFNMIIGSLFCTYQYFTSLFSISRVFLFFSFDTVYFVFCQLILLSLLFPPFSFLQNCR